MTHPARALEEAALSSIEIEKILRVCGPDALLVGVQALATRAVHYGIQAIGVISRTVTMDVDFIGTIGIAKLLRKSLGRPWKLQKGTTDDVGGQLAKAYATLPDEGIKQVDFLSGIAGLDTAAIRRRAALLTLADGVALHLLHPLDVLESRLRNLDSLPSRRNAIGVAQARLAVRVARAFIDDHLDTSGNPRVVRQAVKRGALLALDTRLSHVAFTHDIDVLAAIPVERIAYPRFHEQQWPKVLARLERKREKFLARRTRSAGSRKTQPGSR